MQINADRFAASGGRANDKQCRFSLHAFALQPAQLGFELFHLLTEAGSSLWRVPRSFPRAKETSEAAGHARETASTLDLGGCLIGRLVGRVPSGHDLHLSPHFAMRRAILAVCVWKVGSTCRDPLNGRFARPVKMRYKSYNATRNKIILHLLPQRKLAKSMSIRLGLVPRLAPPSVRPLLRPTPTRPSIRNIRRSCALPPSRRPHTHRTRASPSQRKSPRPSVRPRHSPCASSLLPPLWYPSGAHPRRTLRHIVSSHVRQDAIVVDLAVDLALADELVSLSG